MQVASLAWLVGKAGGVGLQDFALNPATAAHGHASRKVGHSANQKHVLFDITCVGPKENSSWSVPGGATARPDHPD
eukprot:10418592-Alexandrium_andersonii.AAC.1